MSLTSRVPGGVLQTSDFSQKGKNREDTNWVNEQVIPPEGARVCLVQQNSYTTKEI